MARTNYLTLLVGGALLLTTATLPAQSERRLELSFQDGTVTLIAANVTVREILDEWVRKGGSKIINGDRLTGGPVTLQFEQAPERVVMDSLLRSAAGYVLGPRLEGYAGASQFGVISILPTTTSVAGPTYGVQPAPPVRTNPDDEIPPVTPPIGTLDPRRPVNQPANADPNANPNTNQPYPQNRPAGMPATGVVPIVPIAPTPPAPPPPTGGRGRGGGGA